MLGIGEGRSKNKKNICQRAGVSWSAGENGAKCMQNADLLGKVQVLNHEPTIAAVGDIVSSNASKDHYIKLRLKRMDQGEDELQIMMQLMNAEKKRQKDKESMGTSDDSNCCRGWGPNTSYGTQQQHSSTLPQPGIPCHAGPHPHPPRFVVFFSRIKKNTLIPKNYHKLSIIMNHN